VTHAAHGTGDDPVAAPASAISAGQAAVIGLRQPIVGVLLLIALFTTISGKPLDGFLMLTVAMLLASDAVRTRMKGQRLVALARTASGDTVAHSATAVSATVGTGRERRPVKLLLGLAGGAAAALYAGIVGSFSRYSWPATVAVVSLGCLMVAIGWQGPLRQRQALTGQPLRRAWLWAVVLVAGGVWELGSLLQQPHLTSDSYAHPTISALTDPLLADHPGRSVALGGWLLIGWFVVGR